MINANLVTHSSKLYASPRATFRQRTEEQLDGILEKKASAHRLPNGDLFVKPELLCDMGCETPRFNSDLHSGKEYRYFYAISSDVDLENPGTVS